MADAEHFALQPAEPRAERHVEPLEHDLSKRVGVVPLRHDDRGERTAVFLGTGAPQLEPPGGGGAPRRLPEALVAREHVREPFFFEHADRLA